jgi:hypothetical protein
MSLAANLDYEDRNHDAINTSNTSPTTLPILATATDVCEAVKCLKRYRDGITPLQAMDIRKRIFDPRKTSAYEKWGITVRSGDRIKLSSLGWELARVLRPEINVYRTILQCTLPYHSALELIDQQKLQLVTYHQIGSYWSDTYPEVLEKHSQEDLEAYSASFFHICHTAEVGMLTVGRKGQPTRLLIYPDELEAYLKGDHLVQPEAEKCQKNKSMAGFLKTDSHTLGRVCLHHTGLDSIERIAEALELANLQYDSLQMPSNEEPRLEESLAVMRRCESGIMVLGNEAFKNSGKLRDSLLIQIGAALVQFEERLVLILKKGVVLPDTCAQNECLEFDEEITWEIAVRAVRSLKQSKDRISDVQRAVE